MRNMSFSLTTKQMYDRTKTVTRRDHATWGFLRAGDELMAVEKAMGLKKGDSIKRIGVIRIVSVKVEPWNAITDEDVAREGFPGWTSQQFLEHVSKRLGLLDDKLCRRIEFEHVRSA